MQKAVQLGTGFAFIANAVAIVLALAPLQAKSEEVLSPAAQRGLVIVRTNCSRCHAVGKVGDSPLPIAPPFRTSTRMLYGRRRRTSCETSGLTRAPALVVALARRL